MDYEDRVLLQLADASGRAALFDQDALASVAAAGYDHPDLAGPYNAVFDSVDLSVTVGSTVRICGDWYPAPGTSPARLDLTATLPADPAVPSMTALWQGSVVARSRPAGDPLTSLSVQWPELSAVDAAIVRSAGSLPADPAALETARRKELRQELSAAAGTAVLPDDAEFQRWLELVGASSVAALPGTPTNSGAGGYLRFGFADPTATQSSPRPLPVTVALLARDTGFSVASLLAQTAILRTKLRDDGGEPSVPADLRRRVEVIVGWVVPAATFGDSSWPGGDVLPADQRPAARQAVAAGWLAQHGIALIATNLP